MQIKIDSNAISKYEKKLNDLHRSAFPNAIRSTLNDAAFEMKKNNLHTSAAKNFKNTRSKTFFKKFSGFNKAKGWDINKMYSEVGMLDMGQNTAKTAIDNMHLHETGGSVNKGAIYLKGSRTSKNFGKLVSKKNYVTKNNLITRANRKKVKLERNVSRFFDALSENKLTFYNTRKGKFIVRVLNMQSNRRTKKLEFKLQFIKKKRDSVKIKPNKFITKAAEVTRKEIPSNFQKNAEYQINKRLNR